jgi:GMP synthase (glutamine-hydrolysing)
MLNPAVFDLGVPILGICYGVQEIAWHFGKNVLAGKKREYDHAALKVEGHTGKEDHIDQLFQLPDHFRHIASTINAPFAGIASISSPHFGLQFHPKLTGNRANTSFCW